MRARVRLCVIKSYDPANRRSPKQYPRIRKGEEVCMLRDFFDFRDTDSIYNGLNFLG